MLVEGADHHAPAPEEAVVSGAAEAVVVGAAEAVVVGAAEGVASAVFDLDAAAFFFEGVVFAEAVLFDAAGGAVMLLVLDLDAFFFLSPPACLSVESVCLG